MSIQESDQSIFIWGEIYDPTLVVDLVNFLHQSRRSSVLTVVRENVRKSVYFRDGAIIAASSDQNEDRFGDIMFRRGMITRAQLDAALDEVRPGRKIGNILLARGLITTNDLWRVIKLQIEEVLYSVLLVDTGEFTMAAYDATQVPTRTAIDTQFVLLEGLRRRDELAHMREQLPSPDHVMCRTGLGTNARLEPPEQRLLGLVDGVRSVDGLYTDSGLGEFGASRALHRLFQLGLVSVAPEVQPGEAGGGGTSVGAIVSGYNEAYARIHAALVATESGGDYGEGLDSFFADADDEVSALFDGVSPGLDGRLPGPKVMANLKVSGSRDKLFTLRRGLSDYLRFLLFIGREALPFEQVEALAKEVRGLVRGL